MNPLPLIRRILDAGLVPVIVGPTASGKTASAVRLAAHFGGALEIVSADAFQVYRGMEIGTAKPSPAERQAVRHHLVDICDPRESYTAGRFAADAALAIADVKARGCIPMVVGGSGLYLSALIYGLHVVPEDAAPAVTGHVASGNMSLMGCGKRPSWPAAVVAGDGREPADRSKTPDRATLLTQLRDLDPAAAVELAEAPRPRILRAVELVRGSGRPLAELRRGRRQGSGYGFRIIRIVTDRRGILYPRINARVESMFAGGLVEEVEGLRRSGVGRDAPSQRAIGYRETHRLLDGEVSMAEAIALTQRNTRRYAKRQETWFRTQFRSEDVVTLEGEDV